MDEGTEGLVHLKDVILEHSLKRIPLSLTNPDVSWLHISVDKMKWSFHFDQIEMAISFRPK